MSRNSRNKFQSKAAGGAGVSVQSLSSVDESPVGAVPAVLSGTVDGDQPASQVSTVEAVSFASDAALESAVEDQPLAELPAEESVILSNPAEAPLTLLLAKVKGIDPELTDEAAIDVIEKLEAYFRMSVEELLASDRLVPGFDFSLLDHGTESVLDEVPADHYDLDVEQARVDAAAATDEATPAPESDPEWLASQGIPATWTIETVQTWINLGGPKAGRTTNGTFVIDPTRMMPVGANSWTFDGVGGERPIASWSLGEVEDAFALKLHGVSEDHFDLLVKQLRHLTDVPTAWSTREVIDNVTQQIIPRKASNGAWINDVTRANRPATDWTSQELEAWALGELKTPPLQSDVKLAMELNKRFDLKCLTQAPADVIRLFKQSRDPRIKPSSTPAPQPTVAVTQTAEALAVDTAQELPQGLTAMNLGFIEGSLQRYYDVVAPGKSLTVGTGEKAQRQLDTLFRYILQLEDAKGFKSAMDIVREFVRKHRDGLFSATYVFRFTGGLRTDQNIQETHINLLDLFNVFTDPTKLARAQCDVPTMVAKFPADRQTWLIEYFTKYC